MVQKMEEGIVFDDFQGQDVSKAEGHSTRLALLRSDAVSQIQPVEQIAQLKMRVSIERVVKLNVHNQSTYHRSTGGVY